MAASDSGLGLFFGGSSVTSPFLHVFAHDYVSNVLHDARNNNSKILSMIPQNKKYVGGRHVRERVKYGRNPRQFNGVGDNGKFPDPGQRRASWYAYRSRQSFGRFILDGKLVRAVSNGAADIDPLMDELDSFLDDYELDKARQMYSDGSGRLCEMAENGTAAATQTFTFQLNQEFATGQTAPGASATGMSDEAPTRHLIAGMRVLIVTATGTPKCVCNVDSITDDDEAVLSFLAGATGVTDLSTIVSGDWVVKTGNTDSGASTSNAQMVANSAFKAEQQGLGGILGYYGPIDGTGPAAEVGSNLAGSSIEATGSGIEAYQWGGTDNFTAESVDYFQGLACKSSGAGWDAEMTFNQGIVNHNSGTLRAATENLLMQILDDVEEANSAEIEVWVSGYAARRIYAQQLTGEKRYNNTLNLLGGWSRTIAGPAGVPWAVDRMCPHNTIWGLALQDGGFQQWITEELSWATEQGANIWSYLQDHDRYQARVVEEGQIGVGVRNRCGVRVMDIEES